MVIPLSVAGTAGSGDYSGVPTSVTINANTRTQTFTLNAVADSVADTGETIIISIDSDHPTFGDVPHQRHPRRQHHHHHRRPHRDDHPRDRDRRRG